MNSGDFSVYSTTQENFNFMNSGDVSTSTTQEKSDFMDSGDVSTSTTQEKSDFMDSGDVSTSTTQEKSDFMDSELKIDNRFDVLLNSYPRSGSSITGRLLGYRDDAFYFYEPFWKDLKREFYKGRNTICNYITAECRWIPHPLTSEQNVVRVEKATQLLAKYKNVDPKRLRGMVTGDETETPLAANEGMGLLRAVYSCSFDHKSAAFIAHIGSSYMYGQSGQGWQSFRGCRKENSSQPYITKNCVPSLVPPCKAAIHRVTKVLRLSLDNTESLLRENPRLKVLMLVRDPRAILYSQRRLGGWVPFPVKDQYQVQMIAKVLCSKMVIDTQAAIKLSDEYPNRVKIIQYEDYSNALKLVEFLYNFLGMDFGEKYSAFAKTLVGRDHNLFSYRNGFSWETIRAIDSVCKEVYSLLGYRSFKSEQDLRNDSRGPIKDRLPFSVLD